MTRSMSRVEASSPSASLQAASDQTPIDCPSSNCRAAVIHRHPPRLQLYYPRSEHAVWQVGFANPTNEESERNEGNGRERDHNETEGERIDDSDVEANDMSPGDEGNGRDNKRVDCVGNDQSLPAKETSAVNDEEISGSQGQTRDINDEVSETKFKAMAENATSTSVSKFSPGERIYVLQKEQRQCTPPRQVDPGTPKCPGAPRSVTRSIGKAFSVENLERDTTHPSWQQAPQVLGADSDGIRVYATPGQQLPANYGGEKKQDKSQDELDRHRDLENMSGLAFETRSEQSFSVKSSDEEMEDDEHDGSENPFLSKDRVNREKEKEKRKRRFRKSLERLDEMVEDMKQDYNEWMEVEGPDIE